MGKLVIAEKPMLARDIARAITGKEVSESARLPISGNGYTVCACAGHLLELVEPDVIDPKYGKPWNLDVLPIEIKDWPKTPAVDKKTGESKKPLIDEIAVLLKTCDSVIAAGDPDDEGQLIVDELLDYLGYTGKVERVYVNDNIEKNIVRAFEHLIPNDTVRNVGDAAYARQMADKCFGINESRLATVKLGAMFTVGRVQTPTLGLVVNRDEAIAHHVTRKFYELFAHGGADGQAVSFKFKPGKELLAGEKHLFDADALKALADALEGSDLPFRTTVSKSLKNPPLPYNLTVLLADMSKRYGFSAAETQQITQDLRDKYKAITYNRSDSQYLKEEHHQAAPDVLKQAMENLGVTWPLDYSLHSKAFCDKNVTAHHGIIPQEITVPVSEMTPDEAKVYTAICERYAAQFLPPATFDVSESTIEVAGGVLSLTARRMTDAGFLAVFGDASDDEETGDEDNADVFLSAGEHVLAGISCSIMEGETTPPKPYTEGSLISDMASIARYVTDPDVKKILQQKDDGKKGEHGGIGTTATRASILENLKARGYLEEKKGKLRATEEAKVFYHLLPPEIKGADVTAKWWLIQQDVAEGKADVNAVQDSVIEVFLGHKASAYEGAVLPGSGKVIGTCPICGGDVLLKKSKAGKTFATCSSNKNEKQEDGTWKQVAGCGFKLFGFAGKTFTEKQMVSLLSGKAVSLKELASHADIEDESQTVTITKPEVRTSAVDAVDGDKDAVTDTNVSIVDTVKYKNVTPGKTYKVSGTLYEKVTGKDGKVTKKKLLDADGKEITAETEFTPEDTYGSVDVTFTFDGSLLKDETPVVAFESLSYKDKELASHADIEDKSQTVTMHTPKVGTTATDKLDGDKNVIADAESTITDEVAYEHVLPGQAYTMAGILMDAKTGLPVLTGEGVKKYTEDDLKSFVSGLMDVLGFSGSTYTVKVDGKDWGEGATIVMNKDGSLSYDASTKTENEDGSWTSTVDKQTLTPQEDGSWVLSGFEGGGSGTSADGGTSAIRPLDSKTYKADEVEVTEGDIDWSATTKLPTASIDMEKVKAYAEENKDLLSCLVTKTSAFTPEKENGTVSMDFGFNSNDVIDRLSGETKNLVVFEVMFKGDIENASDASPVSIVATECDKDNEGQTVKLLPSSIGTTATDKSDGDHELMAGKDAVITDEVRYEGLIPGKEYTLHATLMDKKTGEPLKVNDKGVTAELKFTPNSESGTVSIDLGEFDATSLDGHTLVVFEELTKQSDIDGETTDVTVAEHKDIEDEDQSVTVTSTPNGSTYGKTGIDMTNVAIAIGILLIAAGCACAYAVKNRKGKDSDSDASDKKDASEQ